MITSPDQLPLVCTLKDVAPLMQCGIPACWNQLQKGTFPIRYIHAHPYRFAKADVLAWALHGTVTNPLLVTRTPHGRTYFGRGKRALLRARA